jgi:2-polyprenyl-3-methyl-5-hydroxy-6-metoxy-1,4-benzoquinol methylase
MKAALKAWLNQTPWLRAAVEAVRPNPYFVADPRTPHLAGYRRGGDPNTQCDALYQHFYSLGCRTALDVGCAEGLAVARMLELGYDAWGLDGFAAARRHSPCPSRIVIHDLVTRPFLSPTPFDFVWCSEVAEHIEERFAANLVLTLAGNAGRYVAMTHAEPGQEGYHHVNCQPGSYWVQLMAAAGLRFDEAGTRRARDLMRHSRPSSFFVKNGLVFERAGSARGKEELECESSTSWAV